MTTKIVNYKFVDGSAMGSVYEEWTEAFPEDRDLGDIFFEIREKLEGRKLAPGDSLLITHLEEGE